MSTPVIRVVSAVISRGGHYLITQRRPSAVLPGLWEFPGGRVEENESDAAALAREVEERVGVKVQVGDCIGRRDHEYEGYSVQLALYRAEITEGEPRPVHVADCRWVTSDEFDKYTFPAADQATMDLLLGFKKR